MPTPYQYDELDRIDKEMSSAWQSFMQGTRTRSYEADEPDKSTKERLDRLEKKIDHLTMKLDQLFGGHFLLDGKWIRIK